MCVACATLPHLVQANHMRVVEGEVVEDFTFGIHGHPLAGGGGRGQQARRG